MSDIKNSLHSPVLLGAEFVCRDAGHDLLLEYAHDREGEDAADRKHE